MQRYIKFFLLLFLAFVFSTCKQEKAKTISPKVLKKIDVTIRIKRFDTGFMSLNKVNYFNKIEQIKKAYPRMFELFMEKIANAGPVNDKMYAERLREFLLDKYTRELYNDVKKKYKDVNKIEADLSNAFKYVKFYFPADTIPEIYFMLTNFDYQAVSYENLIAISLDMFLGTDYRYYPSVFSNYQIRCLREEYILPVVMKTYFSMKFPEESYSGKSLLSQMIYKGKMLYYLDLMLPAVSDTLKIQYTDKQIKWCKDNEGELWNHFADNKILFETDFYKNSRYINDGPFTNAYGIPTDCPPRIIEWVGWQMIRKYAELTKSDLKTILLEKDFQKILNLSGYKPRIKD